MRSRSESRGLSYAAVAWCYDEIAAVYSAGRIRRAKLSHVGHLRAGDPVLYAGVGRGDDAVEAARLGAQVTALDASPAMLSRLRRRLESRRLDATLVEADLFDHTATGYRWAVASFFLNVFSPPAMRGAVEHLTERLAPDGRLAISDFAPPGPGVVGRAFAHANYWPVALAGRALGLAALHPIYDYQPVLERLGFEIEQRERFGAYESLVARRSRR